MPKISVIMGVYNCENTVAKSIESIINQTVEDWELIICDDGSSDNTYKEVKQYVEKDNRICLIRNAQNHGLPYTLNRCLEYAKGEYCARMDGDDLCDVLRFEKQLGFLEAHKEYGFVSTMMYRFDEKGIYQMPKNGESYSPTIKDFAKGSPFCHAPVMIRTSSYHKINGYRDLEKTRGVEDYDLWFRLYSNGIKGYILAEPLYGMFDGKGAAKRRTYKRRLNEAWVRWQGYKMVDMPYYLRFYVLKPLVIGLIPQWLYRIIR